MYMTKVHRALKKFSLRLMRYTHIDSFNRWKKFALTNVDTKKNNVHSELQAKVNEFEAFVDQTREVNV